MLESHHSNADFCIDYYKKILIPFPRNIRSEYHIDSFICELNSIIKQCNSVISSLEKLKEKNKEKEEQSQEV